MCCERFAARCIRKSRKGGGGNSKQYSVGARQRLQPSNMMVERGWHHLPRSPCLQYARCVNSRPIFADERAAPLPLINEDAVHLPLVLRVIGMAHISINSVKQGATTREGTDGTDDWVLHLPHPPPSHTKYETLKSQKKSCTVTCSRRFQPIHLPLLAARSPE